ncbi:hypothetical protein QR680_007476 [Steinernema hermaphroditum]|uniref:Uncharacterized protein n=1 Tax=Steinernema hermaphroditum TaxID=289476 RepID=A0AA39M6G2_9BILA|nr:hypothetical protein QR680_007476 [Steinernema hermaphroditum]
MLLVLPNVFIFISAQYRPLNKHNVQYGPVLSSISRLEAQVSGRFHCLMIHRWRETPPTGAKLPQSDNYKGVLFHRLSPIREYILPRCLNLHQHSSINTEM